MRTAVTIFLLAAGLSLASGQAYPGCPRHAAGLHAYENPLYDTWLSAYDVKSYYLELSLSNLDTEIEGLAVVHAVAERDLDTLVLELQDALTVSRVRCNDDPGNLDFPGDQSLEFTRTEDAVYVVLDRTHLKGEAFQVAVEYGGDAGQDRGFFAGITTEQDHEYGFQVTYTLSEPHNARDWFPVKQVLEDKIDSVTVRIRCDRELLAGSNGVLQDIEEDGEDHILTWKTAYPMAYYLLSVAVADYRDLSFMAPLSMDGDSVLVQNYLYDSDVVMADWEEGVRMTGPLIESLSGLLVDYPFAGEKYGHCMAPMGGGMEHQTMTTIQDFNFYLVAHELGHQWFGDYVTCGNWQDVWINEGFASYVEYIAAQELLGQDAADAWMENAMSIALRETSGSVYVPEDRVEDTYRLFDYGLSYKKGAVLLHMIRFILDDDELFFQVLRTYLKEYAHSLAKGSDFQEVLERVSAMDFSCFFEQWYYGEGFPRFTLFWEQQGDSLSVQSEQTATSPGTTPFFRLPFEVEIRLAGGATQRIRLMQESAVSNFTLPVEGQVEELLFDPDAYLLASSSVVQELPSRTAFRYGPNPVSGSLFIQFPNIGRIGHVRITSLSGKEVWEQADVANPATMDLGFLADGAYLLELSNDLGTFRERIVKVSAE
jgi:aminopeptidase N